MNTIDSREQHRIRLTNLNNEKKNTFELPRFAVLFVARLRFVWTTFIFGCCCRLHKLFTSIFHCIEWRLWLIPLFASNRYFILCIQFLKSNVNEMTTHTALYVVLKCNNVYRHTLAHTHTQKSHCCCCRFILQMTERAKLSTVDLSAISVTLSLSIWHQDVKFPVQMFSYVSLFIVALLIHWSIRAITYFVFISFH